MSKAGSVIQQGTNSAALKENAQARKPSEVRVIAQLNTNDVVCGTGPIVNYEGNKRFRELVRVRKAEMMGTGRPGAPRKRVSHELYTEISRRGGRFVRTVHAPERARALLSLHGDSNADWKVIWLELEKTVAVRKIKQALREKKSKTRSKSVEHETDASDATRQQYKKDLATSSNGGSLSHGGHLVPFDPSFVGTISPSAVSFPMGWNGWPSSDPPMCPMDPTPVGASDAALLVSIAQYIERTRRQSEILERNSIILQQQAWMSQHGPHRALQCPLIESFPEPSLPMVQRASLIPSQSPQKPRVNALLQASNVNQQTAMGAVHQQQNEDATLSVSRMQASV